MKIKYYGNSSFLFRSKQSKLLTNPKDQGVKINLKRVEPDIIVVSHKTDISEDGYYLITSPGEYEVKDIFVYGFKSEVSKKKDHQADVYMIDVESIHFGMIDKNVSGVSEWILNEMGIVNVLFISLSEESEMKMQKIVDLTNRIEPQIVVPMDFTKQRLQEFAKIMGIKEMEEEEKLNVSRSDFSDEETPMRLVVLGK